MTHKTFLDLIAAAAEGDRSARWIYADWLEEREDSRCEFIRVMETLAVTPPAEPRYAELRKRRNALRPSMPREWVRRLGYETAHRPLFHALPDDRKARWRLILELVDTWHEPAETPGYAPEAMRAAEENLGFALPTAVKELYGLLGRRGELWTKLLHFMPLGRLADETSNTLVLWRDPEGDEAWGIPAKYWDREDPPVHRLVERRGEESPTLTAFVALSLLMALTWVAPHTGSFDRAGHGPMFDYLDREFARGDLPTRLGEFAPIALWEGEDLVFFGLPHDRWLHAAARTEEALHSMPIPLRRERLVFHGFMSIF